MYNNIPLGSIDDTTAGLITLLREKETIPTSGAAYSDPTLLRYLNQALQAFIVPKVQEVMEEYFIITRQIGMEPQQGSYTSAGITDKNYRYPVDVDNVIDIPPESTCFRLRDVYVLGPDGSFFNLPRLTPTQAASQSFGNPWGPSLPNYTSQYVGGFFLQGNSIQIYPFSLASGKLFRITYQQRPADLCLTDNAARIISIPTNSATITVDKILTTWLKPGVYVSVTSYEPGHQYRTDQTIPQPVYGSPVFLDSIQVVNVAANTITFADSNMVSNMRIGDWIAPAFQSPYAQLIPQDLYPVLIQKASSMCIHAAGDTEGYQVAENEYKEMIQSILTTLQPRVIGKPIKMLPTNSPFRASRSSNYGRW